MTAVLATKPARAADTSTFALQVVDFSGTGAGPFGIVHVIADANGNLIGASNPLPAKISTNAPRAVAAGSLTNNNDAVTLAVDGMNTAIVQVATGGWSGSIVFEASADGGTTYAATNMAPYAGGPGVSTVTAGGLWEMACGGLTHVRARASGAITSGPASVVVAATNGLKSIRVGAPASNPVPARDTANQPYSDWPTIAPSDSTTISGAAAIAAVCTVAGNVVMQSANSNNITWPLSVGASVLPFLPAKIMSTGTNATATFYKMTQS